MTHRRLPLALALLACIPLLPALGSGFQLDDHFQRLRLLGYGDPAINLFVFYTGDPARNLAGMDAGWLPWWSAEHLRHASLRYLSVLTMQLDYLLWPNRPALMHLHSLAWLGGLVAAAAHFHRRILGAIWPAGLAALLYALDDAHALPAAYLANRNALVATFFGVLCLTCFARSRQEGWRTGALLSPLFLALALAAGEIALATAGYLFAYSLFLDRDSLGGRARALAPHAAVLLAWALVYELGGFGAEGSGFYTDPLRSPLQFARALLERAPVLLMGQWTPLPADLALVVRRGSAQASQLRFVALGTVGVLVAVLAPLVRRDRVARFLALGAALSLLPIAAVGPQNRLLFFVGLGSMGLLAQLLHALVSRAPTVPSGFAWRLPALAIAAALLMTHVLIAPPIAVASLRLQDRANAALVRAVASVPADPSLREQDLILVNPPDYVYAVAAIPAIRTVEGLPNARHMRALAAGSSAMEVTRLDECSLRVRLTRGLFPDDFSRYFRAAELRFAPSERIELSGFSVEIQSLDTSGDPNEIVYRFAVPLEDPALRWLRWDDGLYVSWRAPAVGETVSLPESRGIFDSRGESVRH